MKKHSLRLLLLLTILCGIVSACPPQKTTVTTTKANEPVEAIEQRIMHINVLYNILQKDVPPEEETLGFREKLAHAEKAVASQDYAQASQLSLEAEVWIEEARPRYYERHLKLIKEGKEPKSGEVMMDEAMEYLKKGSLARDEGEQWVAEQYFQAAIEHGEAALLAEEQKPEQTVTLLQITRQMGVIYNASGRQGLGRESRERVSSHALSVLGNLETEIKDLLEGKIEGYDQASLARNCNKFNNAAREVNRLNRLYMSIVSEYNQTFSDKKYEATNFGSTIAVWEKKWKEYCQTPEKEIRENNKREDPKESAMKKRLDEHNKKYKKGAIIPIENSCIYLDEIGFTAHGQVIVLKCVIQNLCPEPIYGPRVVVTGGLMSNETDLGYFKLNPLLSSTFQIPVQYYSTEHMIQIEGLPAHELLLIYKESPDGPEKKVIRSIGRRTLQ